jgi:predicted ATP-grasp superfamily ATP-dependent carboligase
MPQRPLATHPARPDGAPPRALIVGDGWQRRNVLAAARGLRDAGWMVGLAATRPALAAASRAVGAVHPIPSPTEDFAAFADVLPGIVSTGGYDIVFAGGDAEVMAIAEIADRLEAVVPYPSAPEVARAHDKLVLAREAEAAGLGTPLTSAATPQMLESVPLPVVVKPRLHWSPGTSGAPDRLEAAIVHDRAELRRRARRITDAGGEAILQEVIQGDIVSYVAVIIDPESGPIVEFQQLSVGTWPTPAGVVTRAEIMPLDADLATGSRELLRRLRWTGLVQLQFVLPADGTPRVIDLNGRFYASLALPMAAGLNLPAAWAAAALGGPAVAPAPRPGVRFQWLVGDLRRATVERRGGLWRDLADCLRYRRGSVHSVWDPRDPVPALRLVASYLRPRALRQAIVPSRSPRRRTPVPRDDAAGGG